MDVVLQRVLGAVALVLGGRPGAPLDWTSRGADRITLLRHVRAIPDLPQPNYARTAPRYAMDTATPRS